MIFSIDFVHVTFLLVTFFFFFGFFTCDLSILVFFTLFSFGFKIFFYLWMVAVFDVPKEVSTS